jgi:Holliday junction DNA helicase RuvB
MTYVDPALEAHWVQHHVDREVVAGIAAAPQAEPARLAGPVDAADRQRNPLRPMYLDEVIGQERAKRLMRRLIDSALRKAQPLDHVLLVGPSGVGKSTFANVIANEMGVRVFQVEAPISHDMLLELREQMLDGDVLFIDEVHQQALRERRGRTGSTQPEVLFNVMEDRTLVSGMGVLDFPAITVIGATTDEGALPDPFVNRFPLRPVLEHYSQADLEQIARLNGVALAVHVDYEACIMFAQACRGVPRQINNYVKAGASLVEPGQSIDAIVADEVLDELNRVTHDGLTIDMQRTLTFLLTRCKRVVHKETRYQASVNTIATAIGKSRDSKAVTLRVEPYLIERGFLQVGHGGRLLTDAGVLRAEELLTNDTEGS